MNNIFRAQETAIKEFERLLIASAWQDGYSYGESFFKRDKSKPLFFRNTAPAIDSNFKTIIGSESRIVYMIYSIVSGTTYTANNKPYERGNVIEFSLNFWTDEKYNYYTDENSSTTVDDAFMNFASDLMDKLNDNLWVYEDVGEQTQVLDESSFKGYLNGKTIIIKKNF